MKFAITFKGEIIMARIFDVIEYPNEMKDEIVHRFPETGIGDYRLGSQVIVRESQAAVFFRDGNALDVFRAGRHTIATANIPLLIDFIGKAFNDRTPFPRKCISSR
jgi:membrane protease subunit (stomatin/prohibitin family)